MHSEKVGIILAGLLFAGCRTSGTVTPTSAETAIAPAASLSEKDYRIELERIISIRDIGEHEILQEMTASTYPVLIPRESDVFKYCDQYVQDVLPKDAFGNALYGYYKGNDEILLIVGLWGLEEESSAFQIYQCEIDSNDQEVLEELEHYRNSTTQENINLYIKMVEHQLRLLESRRQGL